MMTPKQQKILIWSAVVLLVLNVSTLVTIGFHTLVEKEAIDTGQQENPAQLKPTSENFSGRYFRDRLELSADQMKQFFKINQRFRSEAFSIQDQLAEIRKNMLEELSSEQSDTLKLNKLSSELGSLHGRLKVISFQYYLNIKELCNKEQKIKLKEIFQIFFETETPIGNPGPGRYRKGQGWRNNSNNN